jgi:histidinol phosphatase-like enzyme (inositol monophosphatase family)
VSPDQQQLQSVLDFAVEVARGAGEITLKYFRKSPETKKKTDGSFVTIADREAEAYIRARISARYPDDGILGEETGESTGPSGRRWIVDPIDGTFSFVHGVPLYGVLIALEDGYQPVLGVVNLPALDEIVYAARGLGSYFNGELCRVSQTASLSEALVVATDVHSFAAHGFAAAAATLQSRARVARTWGDCYGHVLVATGRADLMLDPIMNIWDCAALLPIVEEAGGTFTDWQGRRTIDGGNAISTNGSLFETVMQTVTENREGVPAQRSC